jgi:hypothetical protein
MCAAARSRSSASTRVFLGVAAILGLAAAAVWARFVVAYIEGNGKGHVQSLILGAVLFNAAVMVGALGVIGDLLSAQRTMIQRTFERVRRIELKLGVEPSHYERGDDAAAAAAAGGGDPPADSDGEVASATREGVPS